MQVKTKVESGELKKRHTIHTIGFGMRNHLSQVFGLVTFMPTHLFCIELMNSKFSLIAPSLCRLPLLVKSGLRFMHVCRKSMVVFRFDACRVRSVPLYI